MHNYQLEFGTTMWSTLSTQHYMIKRSTHDNYFIEITMELTLSYIIQHMSSQIFFLINGLNINNSDVAFSLPKKKFKKIIHNCFVNN